MDRLGWLVAFLLVAAPGLPAAEQLFDLKPVVPGVWAAIAKPQFKVNCNAAVVELEDGLLVVDTHSKPSAARALIEQLKTVSAKRVRYVVDTHFHWDHYQGNQAYPAVWPQGLEVISSEATRESIEHRGIPRMKNEILFVTKEIAQLKADLAKAIGPEQRAQISENLRQAESYLAELQSMRDVLPTLTFDRSLIIHRPSRSVHILWLGKAHTDGDVFVYLPKDKVIATGDALQGWLPYMGDGYPYDWIKTLDAAMKLDFDYAIGGHGDVLHGKGQFELFKSYLNDLMASTAEAYARGESMKDAEKSVAARLSPQYAAKFPAGIFDGSVGGNIQKAYRVVSGATD
jgi:glyoxylase-like metal-dependent hydrolase (beta-lactamase superfamily II)